MNRLRAIFVLAVLAGAKVAAGQVAPGEPVLPPTPTPPPASSAAPLPEAGTPNPADAPAETWAFYASVYAYFVPEQRDYAQPTFTADHDWLHLEARYNYEAQDTGSLWAGYNLSGGEELKLAFTPMLGAVFGDLNGVAPGFNLSLSYKQFEFTSQGEYVFDFSDSTRSNDFFYSWSELTWSPEEWIHLGFVGQRTKAYKSDRVIDPGVLLGFTYESVDFTMYVFNLDESRPTYVLSVGFGF